MSAIPARGCGLRASGRRAPETPDSRGAAGGPAQGGVGARPCLSTVRIHHAATSFRDIDALEWWLGDAVFSNYGAAWFSDPHRSLWTVRWMYSVTGWLRILAESRFTTDYVFRPTDRVNAFWGTVVIQARRNLT